MNKLLLIQQELKVPKNQYNSFGKYKYRKAEDIFEAVKPILAKHKCVLTLTDEIKSIEGVIFCEATALLTDLELQDSDGGHLMARVKAQAGIDPTKKGMDLSQSFGASSSYARKYALNGLFLLDDVADAEQTNTHGKTEQPEIIDENKLKERDYYSEIKDTKKLGEVTKWWNSLNKSEKKYAVSAKDRKKRELLDIDTKIKNIKSNTTDKILTDVESTIDQITDEAERESAITAYNNKLKAVGIDHEYEPLPFK